MSRFKSKAIDPTERRPDNADPADDAEESALAGSSQGDAGASAQREFERRRDKRAQRIREKYPRFGGLILALSEDPQSIAAWEKGAKGERAVGERLDKLVAAGLEILHDRRIPGTRANIDHIAVSTAGAFVIDPKRYKGKVERRDVGGFFKTDHRLFVGNRDRSKLVEGVVWQVEQVRTALADAVPGVEIPLSGTLCFVDAEWSLFQRPMNFNGVTVLWPKELIKVLAMPGTLSHAQVKELAGIIAAQFPPA